MKKAVIYARYSSDNQSEQSIEGQIRVCNEYAERNNIMIIDSYIDRAMTGTNDRRPEFQRMISDSSKKEWDYVIVQSKRTPTTIKVLSILEHLKNQSIITKPQMHKC